VSDVTGFPEILDGRVKTLHPIIHAGLLAVLDNPVHRKQLDDFQIQPIDLVVVNLYPFQQTISIPNAKLEEAIEQIDIGGPAMLRSAAKNYRFTAVVSNPAQYPSLIAELMERSGAVTEETCLRFAREAFAHTAQYDTIISHYLAGLADQTVPEIFPDVFSLSMQKVFNLRYGENPHQSAALYGSYKKSFTHIHGKDLSYNNILDIDASVKLVFEFDEPAAVIIKHMNPCGVGIGVNISEAYHKAIATDQKSAFGGIIALNREVDIESAKAINDLFSEVIAAPAFLPEALELLSRKKDRRLIAFIPTGTPTRDYDIRSVTNGILVQSSDRSGTIPIDQLKVVTKRHPTDEEFSSLLFAWKVVKHVKSNAIVYSGKDRTLGIGAGQMSRVDSSKLAIQKASEAGLSLAGSVVGSDAFFPFADGLLEAISAGATAVIQPGGSRRDDEVIKAANDQEIAMIFTGIRHFRH
jgi:phosphoribosylaminoimidazolecarboxamide formyltransferase/IMP cyclohydrolase